MGVTYSQTKPNQTVQLQDLVDTDSETESRIKRVQEEILQEFKITTTDSTSDTDNVDTENDNIAKLGTNTKRNKDLSIYKLAHKVNALISESLEKDKNRMKPAKKNPAKENKNMKKNIQCRLRICNNNE
jgi:hypothetical protein